MDSILSDIDQLRKAISSSTDEKHKSQLGQYFTPHQVALFMASLFELEKNSRYKILDAGAGIGSLSVALLTIMMANSKSLDISLTAIEYDSSLIPSLQNNLDYFDNENIVVNTNFIDWGKENILKNQQYDLAILNPPYKKLLSNSKDKKTLRSLGIEVVNFYAAFVALALELLSEKGQMVVIIPRSFCNGAYFKPFRNFLLARACIHTIHSFESRQDIFYDEKILQENVILYLVKGKKQGKVKVSYSKDAFFNDLDSQVYDFDQIVKKRDKDQFIHIPTKDFKDNLINSNLLVNFSQLGIQVSTGPVVDFRVKPELMYSQPVVDHAPLLYPNNFNKISHFKKNHKKPNFILINEKTVKIIYKKGYYCIVRRFSLKEQQHRIVSHFVDAKYFNSYEHIAFENHLNVFHIHKEGLKREVALGLTIYLNSKPVDQFFRQFSGHTQINIGDLKRLPYPSINTLEEIGTWASKIDNLTQDEIDRKIIELFSNVFN